MIAVMAVVMIAVITAVMSAFIHQRDDNYLGNLGDSIDQFVQVLRRHNVHLLALFTSKRT